MKPQSAPELKPSSTDFVFERTWIQAKPQPRREISVEEEQPKLKRSERQNGRRKKNWQAGGKDADRAKITGSRWGNLFEVPELVPEESVLRGPSIVPEGCVERSWRRTGPSMTKMMSVSEEKLKKGKKSEGKREEKAYLRLMIKSERDRRRKEWRRATPESVFTFLDLRIH